MRAVISSFVVATLLSTLGCGSSGKAYPPLNPVIGVVNRDGKPLNFSGTLTFVRTDGATGGLSVTANVTSTGRFAVQTVWADVEGAVPAAGMPVGTYKVTFTPPPGFPGYTSGPTELDAPVTIEGGPKNLTLELPKAKAAKK